MWFLVGSIDPVAAYLRGRAPRCLFWRREGSPCEALTIRTAHKSGLGPKLKQAAVFAFVHTCIVHRIVCACVRGMIIKHSIAVKAEQQSSLLGYRGLDKDYRSQWQWGDCPCHCLLRIDKEREPRRACQRSRQLDAGVSRPVHCQGRR